MDITSLYGSEVRGSTPRWCTNLKMEPEIVIYTITSLYLKDPDADHKFVRYKDQDYKSRLVGFYKTLEKAQLCVNEDWAHFDECGYYNLIVIEGLWEGCYPGLGDNEWWYRHDYDNRQWVPCEKPKFFSNTVNFYG